MTKNKIHMDWQMETTDSELNTSYQLAMVYLQSPSPYHKTKQT